MGHEPIGAMIKSWRDSRGWSQRYLGAKLDVSGPAVHAWEVGKSNPSGENLILIAEVLTDLKGYVALSAFFGGAPEAEDAA